jgi:hypothetical protein
VARSYDAKLVAFTVNLPFKWIDNLLSHHELTGVTRARQGIPRAITDDGLVAIEIVRLLTIDLGVAVQRAVEIAQSVMQDRAPEVRVPIQRGLVLVIQRADIARRLRERLLDASESVARVRRGRPRAQGAFDPAE